MGGVRMDLKDIEGDAAVAAHDHLRFTQTRASYLSGVARGVSDALSMLEEPGILSEIAQSLPADQAAFPERVARIALRQMSGYKLKHAAMADEAASTAMGSYYDILVSSPTQKRCAFCHGAVGRAADIGNIDYGPPPADDELPE